MRCKDEDKSYVLINIGNLESHPVTYDGSNHQVVGLGDPTIRHGSTDRYCTIRHLDEEELKYTSVTKNEAFSDNFYFHYYYAKHIYTDSLSFLLVSTQSACILSLSLSKRSLDLFGTRGTWCLFQDNYFESDINCENSAEAAPNEVLSSPEWSSR